MMHDSCSEYRCSHVGLLLVHDCTYDVQQTDRQTSCKCHDCDLPSAQLYIDM